jgi:hypothetical protein
MSSVVKTGISRAADFCFDQAAKDHMIINSALSSELTGRTLAD